MRQLNYKHLYYFWSVAREGHLTRASEHLNISQSALSSQIRKLEDQLGHDLFERTGRRLLLTEAGRLALDYADLIFSTGTELYNTLSEHEPSERVLRVGALFTLSRNFQIDFLAPVLGLDDVEVIVRSGGLKDLSEQLENHELDVVLSNVLPAADSGSHWHPTRIASQNVSLIGTPERLDGRNDVVELLKTEPVVLPTEGSSIRQKFESIIARYDIDLKIAAEIEDMTMMRLMAREDVGLAVLPPIVVKDELLSGQLIEADIIPDLREIFYALTLKRRFPNPLVKQLLVTEFEVDQPS